LTFIGSTQHFLNPLNIKIDLKTKLQVGVLHQIVHTIYQGNFLIYCTESMCRMFEDMLQ